LYHGAFQRIPAARLASAGPALLARAAPAAAGARRGRPRPGARRRAGPRPGGKARLVTKNVVERMIDGESGKIQELSGENSGTARCRRAVARFAGVALAGSFAEPLALPGYERMP
jgi:hypothetical protein